MERSPSLYSILKPNYEKVDLEDSGLFGANDNGDIKDLIQNKQWGEITKLAKEASSI